ncbi:MAG: serpin family protein [Planctomycetes bacterium]|nr:serpin family protein [Planctomycetota bacterium]
MRARLLVLLLVLIPACKRNTHEEPPVASPAAKELAARNNRFGLELYREAHKAGSNSAVSPVSLAMALQLAATGAAGETRKQMLDVLHTQAIDLPAGNRDLLDALKARKGMKLEVANSVWVDPARMQLDAAFRGTAETSFDAMARELDFSDAGARNTINQWISDRTSKRIPELIDRIDADVAAYLINAVYFKGEWTERFDKSRSREGEFRLANGTVKEVPMMHRDGDFDYAQDGDTQVARLTFGPGKGASMWFALPSEKAGVEALVATLKPETIERWAAAAKPSELPLALPRFTFRHRMDAGGALRSLGMTMPFDEGAADFSKMGKGAAGNLFISRVLHEVFVEVNEEGAEAAAATAVEMKATSAPMPLEFNRPFVFAITDDTTGALLFVGVVADPKP